MQLWEGGIRVPAIVRWPGHIQPNSTTDQVAITMDWTVTIASVAKAKHPALSGIDLTAILTGKKPEVQRTLYWRIFQRVKHKALRDGNWKYIQDEKGNEYLFDLVADPFEKNDRKGNEPVIFQVLKDKYAAWEAQMLKPVPL